MRGHLRKRDNKNGHVWQITIERGAPDPETGKRDRIYKTIPNITKKDAEKIMREMLSELDQKTFVSDSSITVAQFMKEWLDTYIIPHKSPTTIRGYVNNVEGYIIPEFGKIKLQDLTSIEIQKYYNKLAKKSTLSENPLSPKTIRNIHMNLRAALKRAVILDILKKNPADYVELVRCKQYKAEVYNSEELHTLCEVIRGTDLELAVMILVCLGLRRGELLALKWNNIDFEKGAVNIVQNVVQVHGQTYTKDPKTESSKRRIEAPDMLMIMLRREHVNYMRRKLQYGTKFHDTSLVVCQPDGKPYLPDAFSQKFTRFLRAHNLKHIRVHDLRHTNATMMLKLGISPKVAQKRLGHSNYSTTMDIYSHVLEEVEKDAVEKLEAGLQQIMF